MRNVLNKIKQSVFTSYHYKQESNYLEWDDYKSKINFLDTFRWQQSVRRQSIRNI